MKEDCIDLVLFFMKFLSVFAVGIIIALLIPIWIVPYVGYQIYTKYRGDLTDD